MTTVTEPDRTTVDLEIGGMTCASCAARIEKKLNRLDDVEASVNYATERAHVTAPSGLDPQRLIDVITSTGYRASLPEPPATRSRVSSDPTGEPAAAGGPAEDDPDEGRGGAELRSLRQRLIIAAVLSVPVVAMGMIPALQFDYWGFASLVLAAPVVVWAGWPFHRAAALNLRHGSATMDTLISVGTTAALLWSIVALFGGTAGEPGMVHPFELTISRGDGLSQIYLEVAAGVLTFVLLGRYVEQRSKRRAGAALRALLELGAKDVAVLRDGREERIAVADLAVDERFVVRPGEKIATDGEVVEGRSAVDASMVTGESAPVEVATGDAVTGGTLNAGGRLVARATRVGSDTQLAQMARLVADAQSGKAEIQRLADRVSGVFVPVVIAIAVATLGGWLGAGEGPAAAFTAAVAVLIIACPCALGLATPTALLVGTGRGAQLGALIRGPEVLESTRRIDTVVLDKTGTVTSGTMTLQDVVAGSDVESDEVLRMAGAVESGSEHPIARAIVAGATTRLGEVPAVTDFANLAGRGVRATIDGRVVLAGRQSLLEQEYGEVPAELITAKDEREQQGRTVIMIGWDGSARGLISVSDEVKPSSAAAVRALVELGLRPVLLTGDNRAVADQVAAEIGIDEVIAEVMPADKAEVINRLQAEGRVVAMVGDGVNDAPALATADLGLAMGTGTDVAIEAADITLVSGDLRAVVDAIRLSRRTLRTIKINLFWAFAYNTAAIPLAALGLLNPMLAGAAMAFSSIFVVTNSLRLRGFTGSRSLTGHRPSNGEPS